MIDLISYESDSEEDPPILFPNVARRLFVEDLFDPNCAIFYEPNALNGWIPQSSD